MTAIAAATTAADAQAAYDAVKDDVTATQGDALQAAVDMRVAALNKMARADEQKQALMTAADMVDTSDLSTQELVDAARTAIAGLRQAIADAVDVDDTSMYQTQLDNAVAAVDEAQGGIDTETRRTNQMADLESASDTLQDAVAALAGDTPTQEQIDAANNARARSEHGDCRRRGSHRRGKSSVSERGGQCQGRRSPRRRTPATTPMTRPPPTRTRP